MKIAWIQFSVIGVSILIPTVIAMRSRTAQRAAFFGALAGAYGIVALIGWGLYHRGPHALPFSSALVVMAAAGVVFGFIGWLGYQAISFFRTETPRIAIRKSLVFLGLSACRLAALVIVIDAFGILAIVDFATEIPEIMYLRWKARLYPYVALATAIVVAWGYMATRQKAGRPTSSWRFTLFLALPISTIALLFIPILMAWVQAGLAHPLLDCANLRIPGYVPDMIDYTRLALDSVAKGFFLGAAFGIATCAPNEASALASVLVWFLRLVPITIIAWLTLRSFFLGSRLA